MPNSTHGAACSIQTRTSHWRTKARALTNKRILSAKGLIDIKNAKTKIRRENGKQCLMSMLSVIIAAFLFETFVSCRKHALDLDKNS